MTPPRSAGTLPDREELVARARALVPMLAARADDTERHRAILPDVHAALEAAGLYRALAPPYLGGFDLGIAAHLEIAAELARGCGSTAWVQCLVGYQNYLVGWYPKEAQDDVRADATPLYAALVMGPPATAERVVGGVRLTGRWPYVSGVDIATWLMLSARAPEESSRVLTCLIPKRDIAILDDWHVMGLRGTGSKSVPLDGLFVPDHKVLSFRATEDRGTPGAAVNKGALYRGIPTGILFAMVVATPALGLAECAIDAYRERLRSRSNPRMPSSQTEWPSSQARLGRARTRLDAARRAFFDTVDGFAARIERGQPMMPAQRVRDRMATVETVRVCTEIVYDLFTDAGTGVAMDGDVLQRAFRDIHVLRSHFMLTPDLTAENAGRVELGLPPKPPFL